MLNLMIKLINLLLQFNLFIISNWGILREESNFVKQLKQSEY